MPPLEQLSDFLSGLADALEIEESTLTPNTLFNEIDWDSLAVISAIALIDEQFGVMIPGQDISNCKGMPDLISLIQSRISN